MKYKVGDKVYYVKKYYHSDLGAYKRRVVKAIIFSITSDGDYRFKSKNADGEYEVDYNICKVEYVSKNKDRATHKMLSLIKKEKEEDKKRKREYQKELKIRQKLGSEFNNLTLNKLKEINDMKLSDEILNHEITISYNDHYKVLGISKILCLSQETNGGSIFKFLEIEQEKMSLFDPRRRNYDNNPTIAITVLELLKTINEKMKHLSVYFWCWATLMDLKAILDMIEGLL